MSSSTPQTPSVRTQTRRSALAVTLDHLTVDYGSHRALNVTHAQLEPASLVALMGPNGSGKTTLLKVLAGLIQPTSGSITREPDTTVAYVAQHHGHRAYLPLATAEVVRIGRFGARGLLGRLAVRDKLAIESAAERLEITDLLDRRFGSLSGGQQQRALIAMALVQDADLLLLDEPITGLDLVSQGIILDLMAAERDAGRIVVLSTHHLEEARQCDRVILLNRDVIADGPAHDVLQASLLATAFGQRLLSREMCDIPGHEHNPLLLDDHGHGHQGHQHQSSRS